MNSSPAPSCLQLVSREFNLYVAPGVVPVKGCAERGEGGQGDREDDQREREEENERRKWRRKTRRYHGLIFTRGDFILR